MKRPGGVLLLAIACAASLAGRAPVQPSALRVVGLTCEYSTDPMGIDVAAPRLSWRLESSERAQRQTAWQVLVAASREALDGHEGGVWDSGKVASDATSNVAYGGQPLVSSRTYFWKVRAWDADDRPTDWSAAATWTTGLMSRDEWKATWIAAPGASETLLARRDFQVDPGLRRAIVHVSGLGQYELSLNGTRVGRDLFAPGWTDYDKTVLYDTFDVTAHLAGGRNAVGLVLGNGMYNVVRRNRFAKFTRSYGPLRAILRLQLEYDSGIVDAVVTDDRWTTHPGPETFAGIYGGEDHDARLAPPGWDRVGFDDRTWARAVPVLLTTGELVGHSAGFEPVRADRGAPAGRPPRGRPAASACTTSVRTRPSTRGSASAARQARRYG